MAACSAGDPRPFCKQPTRLALSVVDPPPPDVAPSAWAGAVTLEHASVESGCRVVHFVCWEDGLDSLDWYIVRFQCLLPRSGSTIPDRQRLNRGRSPSFSLPLQLSLLHGGCPSGPNELWACTACSQALWACALIVGYAEDVIETCLHPCV